MRAPNSNLGCKGLSVEELKQTLRVYLECGKNASEAARRLTLSNSGMTKRLDRIHRENITLDEPFEAPELPDDDIKVEEIIELQKRRFEKRYDRVRALKWFPIKIKIDGPVGLSWIGDPHVDDDGCNWPLLEHHCEVHRKTEGLFAVNIGDTTNNWVGRLVRLFGYQETSQKTARKLAEWLMTESGITWLIWLLGNHDDWNEGSEILRRMNADRITMTDWQAQFRLVFPNGREARLWASHDFPGHSQWNSLHGPQKSAHMKEDADIYACGHKHNWACHQEESASKEFIYWLIRSRGYKFIDSYAELHGHASQQEGASITSIFNPEARTKADFIHCFADMDRAADYLTYLRKRAKC